LSPDEEFNPMRQLLALSLVLLLGGPLAGCGGGVQEGIPKDVDMTKSYTPAAGTPLINRKAGASSLKPPASIPGAPHK